jgi:hypothetical protein
MPTVILSAHLLSGCQTTRLISAGSKLNSCAQDVVNMSEYAVVMKHWPTMIGTGEPTATQMADKTYPTPEEAEALQKVHDRLAACRNSAINDYDEVNPAMRGIAKESFKEADAIDDDIINRRITWGEANRRYYEGKLKMKDKLVKALSNG